MLTCNSHSIDNSTVKDLQLKEESIYRHQTLYETTKPIRSFYINF